MSQPLTITPAEAANRLAIRELIEAYAHCADRRDALAQMSLYDSTHFVVYMNARDPRPTQELHSREALAPVFSDLNRYAATMHYLGQSTILSLTDDRGTGEAYCRAHHVMVDGGKRRLMIAALRYKRQLRERRRHVAVRGATAVRRLAGGARIVLTVTNRLMGRP
jgi:hypothetical protein